jgi:hypothetical protein
MYSVRKSPMFNGYILQAMGKAFSPSLTKRHPIPCFRKSSRSTVGTWVHQNFRSVLFGVVITQQWRGERGRKGGELDLQLGVCV